MKTATLKILIAILLFAVTKVDVTQAATVNESLRLATFDIDVTPPVGSMMAYTQVLQHDELSLRGRGVILLGAGEPIVLCAIDWIGIANESHDLFRARIAKAAGTSVDRVAVHCLHQHDAPLCDFQAEQIMHHYGSTDFGPLDGKFARDVLDRLEQTVSQSLSETQPVTHAGFGAAKVEKVASNRRLLGSDGLFRAQRYTTCADPKLRAEPEGTIDPELDCLVFYNEEHPLASLTYYACHPQSYYLTNTPSSDFPGIARFMRGQDAPETLHVHFNGAGGNIGAGKYNDGSKQNRILLATRVADGMQRAFESVQRFEISAADIDWKSTGVLLPPAPHLNLQQLKDDLKADPSQKSMETARNIAWLQRVNARHEIQLSCLQVGSVRVLHMPGELFVEFQLAAKQMRPDLHVAMAAYGDYGPGYIGTEIAYGEGGYETSERASLVDKSSEPVLMAGIRELLGSK